MKSVLLPIALAISFLSLSGCSSVFGPKGPKMTPEEKAAQEKAFLKFEALHDMSFYGSPNSVVLDACNDLYGFADGYIDYVRIMDCYHEQVSEPEKAKGPRDLSPKPQFR